MNYLFGPVERAFADGDPREACAKGECLRFGSREEFSPSADARWSEVESSFPAGWKPDFIALWLPYRPIPDWVWTAPIPIVALAADWQLLWHQYRRMLRQADVILTDIAGVDSFQQEGLDQAQPANLYGLEQRLLEVPVVENERDIDVLFVGNLNPSIQRERLPWLARLAQLADHRKIQIASGVFGDAYRDLLRRSRIVFNRSVRGECNKRSFEAPASGALLFQEAGNREIAQWLDEGSQYIAYTPETLLPLIEKFLDDEASRRAVAESARGRVLAYSFDNLWSAVIENLQGQWSLIQERVQRRLSQPIADQAATPLPALLTKLGRVERLVRERNGAEAISIARSLLLDLERPPNDVDAIREAQPWREFDLTRVEWEKAAWNHAGDPWGEAKAKIELLRWRVNLSVAELNGDLAHHYEAVLARPDLLTSQAALGCALARNQRLPEAITHLRRASDGNPFDLRAVRAYYQSLCDAGQHDVGEKMKVERRLLAKAAPGIIPAEDWFAEAPPSIKTRASIIVLFCNEVAVSRPCLDSIRRHTDVSSELILIDNGSTDATPDLLASVKEWTEPAEVHIIRNDTNRGYAAGVNQGLAIAKGDYLVLLNNDTVVTPKWLSRLIGVSLAEDAAMVGPVTNYAPEPQHVQAGYSDLAGLDSFAEQHSQHYGNKTLDFPRLTGFCLLMRRDALSRVGAMDERYGAGFFEDDDLCLRVRRAGMKLCVALGVYIHHEGSKTFRSLGLDTAGLLSQNLERFRDKWGEQAAAPYRKPESTASPLPTPTFTIECNALSPMPPAGVSLTMIVRNEESNLADCLSGVRDLVDEIVIVDTGSTDRTKEIAAEFGAKVADFPWIDHFAAARNEALKHAARRWIFWLDADDRLDENNRQKLKQLFASLPEANVAYSMKCRCVGSKIETVVDHVRLFRNDASLRWEHRVHEQIVPSIRRNGGEIRFCDVEVHHVGYADTNLRAKKLQRDLRLLHMELAEQPDHPFTNFNVGSVYRELGRAAEALPHLQKSLARSDKGDSIVRKLHSLISQCFRDTKQPAEALRVCVEGRKNYPDDPELLYMEGVTREETGDFSGAESCLRRLVDGTESGDHFASINPTLRVQIGRNQLAWLLFRQKRHPEAEAQWRVTLTIEPGYVPALLGLAELYLQTKRWEALDQVASQLGGHPEAEVFRGRAKMARKEFPSARWALSQAAERFPALLSPRVFLSHAILQEGKDWRAAEQSLRDILNLDPANGEAKNNLEVLLREHPNL